LIITNEAILDIESILQYSIETFGESKTKEYLDTLYAKIYTIASMPGIGHRHKYLKEDLRVYNIEKHLVIYQIHEEKQEVVILRILHKNSDLTSLF
jgi:toxin ParE1/3/4